MSRLEYILAALLFSACAGSNSAVHSSSDREPPSEPQRGPQVGEKHTPRETSPGEHPKDDVPEWLKKKPAGDPSANAFSKRMAEEQRQLLQLFDDKAASINFTDGIDAAEAEFIGSAYFTMQFGGCGGTEKASDGGAEWLMRPRFGVTGKPLEDHIRVDKRTGAVRYGSGPSTDAREAIEFERGLLEKSVERFSRRGSAQ